MSTSIQNTSASTSSSSAEPDRSLVLFARGVIAILNTWPVMRIAIQEEWGGPDAAERCTLLASEVVDAFEAPGKTPDQDDVEDLLLQVMTEEFECNVEDDSSIVVARSIVMLWKDVKEGNGMASVGRLEEMASRLRGVRVQSKVEEMEEIDEDDEDEEEIEVDDAEEAPQLVEPRSSRSAPEVDEDGFTVVKGRGATAR